MRVRGTTTSSGHHRTTVRFPFRGPYPDYYRPGSNGRTRLGDSYRPHQGLYPDCYRPRADRWTTPRSRDTRQPRDATFRVVLYRPTDRRDPRHWAVHIMSPTNRGTIHQVCDNVGGCGCYVADERWGVEPERARLYVGAVLVGWVN
ncbi:hypothetical protein F4803DRAFT_504899 [Xylaria telfairii]|nr:hypothetical protein F4803DRAFT_504899 [Xylaria telfairii]